MNRTRSGWSRIYGRPSQCGYWIYLFYIKNSEPSPFSQDHNMGGFVCKRCYWLILSWRPKRIRCYSQYRAVYCILQNDRGVSKLVKVPQFRELFVYSLWNLKFLTHSSNSCALVLIAIFLKSNERKMVIFVSYSIFFSHIPLYLI